MLKEGANAIYAKTTLFEELRSLVIVNNLRSTSGENGFLDSEKGCIMSLSSLSSSALHDHTDGVATKSGPAAASHTGPAEGLCKLSCCSAQRSQSGQGVQTVRGVYYSPSKMQFLLQ